MKTIADRIKEGMEIRQLKQVDIVEKTGINKGALSSYISGKYEPKQNNIEKLAKILDVNEMWLRGNEVPMEREFTIKEITSELLDTYKELNHVLIESAQEILSRSDSEPNEFVELLKDKSTSNEVRAKIYNAIFDHLKYNTYSQNVDMYINLDEDDIILTEDENEHIHKYRSLDAKGKHTVDTVLEMEYNRCKISSDILNAAHAIDGATEEDKKHDDNIMDNDEFWK